MRLRQSASNTVWTIMPCCALLLDRPLRCERAADYDLGVGSSNPSGRANIINVLAASVLPRKCHWRAHGEQANWPAEIHPDDRFYEARGCARARGILGH
jgi:hypothetical protein